MAPITAPRLSATFSRKYNELVKFHKHHAHRNRLTDDITRSICIYTVSYADELTSWGNLKNNEFVPYLPMHSIK